MFGVIVVAEDSVVVFVIDVVAAVGAVVLVDEVVRAFVGTVDGAVVGTVDGEVFGEFDGVDVDADGTVVCVVEGVIVDVATVLLVALEFTADVFIVSEESLGIEFLSGDDLESVGCDILVSIELSSWDRVGGTSTGDEGERGDLGLFPV